MNLSVIIPCYNEVSSIEQVVQSVIDMIGEEGEIIIVDDFSMDGTREMLEKNINGKLTRVIYQELFRFATPDDHEGNLPLGVFLRFRPAEMK
jgi:glycosyltransferase involved in cell wall biosynthesis